MPTNRRASAVMEGAIPQASEGPMPTHIGQRDGAAGPAVPPFELPSLSSVTLSGAGTVGGATDDGGGELGGGEVGGGEGGVETGGGVAVGAAGIAAEVAVSAEAAVPAAGEALGRSNWICRPTAKLISVRRPTQFPSLATNLRSPRRTPLAFRHSSWPSTARAEPPTRIDTKAEEFSRNGS